ncbi:MAG: hypothetical protein AAF320_03330 [Myxococcota bacterium]
MEACAKWQERTAHETDAALDMEIAFACKRSAKQAADKGVDFKRNSWFWENAIGSCLCSLYPNWGGHVLITSRNVPTKRANAQARDRFCRANAIIQEKIEGGDDVGLLPRSKK